MFSQEVPEWALRLFLKGLHFGWSVYVTYQLNNVRQVALRETCVSCCYVSAKHHYQ